MVEMCTALTEDPDSVPRAHLPITPASEDPMMPQAAPSHARIWHTLTQIHTYM